MIEIITAILLIALCISAYYNYKLGLIIIRTEDAIEECLDELDERYKVVSKILEKPIFFDSLEVRQTVQEIRLSQELILKVANKMSNIQEPDQIEENQ
jgi:hypothetical protein